MRRPRPVTPTQILAGYFVRGLLVFVPTVGTLYTVWLVLAFLDEAIGLAVPGVGLLLTLTLILVTGFVVSNVVGQAAIGMLERGIGHLPLVSLLYSSLKSVRLFASFTRNPPRTGMGCAQVAVSATV